MERCVLACLFLLLVHASAARADSRAATEALTAVSADRSAASSGAAAAADWLEREIRIQTGNAPVFRQKFLITVPASLECRAEARDAAALSFPLAPLLPMGGQPPSLGTPGQREFPLLYGRNGTLEDLRGKSLANALVALDISDPEAIGWKRCASLGAAGVIFLGDSQTPVPDFLNKSTMLPLGLPRFYCDDPAAVAWLKTADGPRRLALKLRTAWEERAAENLICILPARGTGDGINQWVVLQARYDAPSQVMTRAPGATTAFNAAALLQLAREIAAAPEHCGVVLVWTSGDQWNLRGTREFLDLLHRGGGGGRAGQAVGFLKARSTDAQQQASAAATILREARSVAAAGWPADPAAIKRAGPIIEEELLRQASAVETRLQRLEGSSPGPEAAALKTQKHALLQATNLANGSASDAPSDARALLQKAAATVVDKWQTDLLRLEAQRDALQNWPQIRAAMPGGDPQSPARPDPLLFLSLALTGGNAAQPVSAPLQWGLLSRSFYSSGLDATGPMSSLSIAFRRYGQLAGDRFEPRALENATVLESLLPLKCAFSSDAAIARGIPAAAFATLLDPNTFLDTPNDTLDHLDFAQLDTQEQALHRFLLGTATNPGLLSDPQLYARVPIPAQVSDQTITLYERAAGENLPRLKAAQALIGGESEVYSQPLGGPLAGTRRDEWLLTHADGTAVFHSLQRAQGELRLQAYEFDDAGTHLRALISNVSPDKNSMVASVFPSESHPVNAMLFEATRLDAYGLFDPRHLDILDKIEILDARRLDSARFLSVYAREGAAAIFMPPLEDMQWQLLAHRGNAGTRLVLLNADAAHPNGTGYQTTSPAALGSLRWRAAQDFYALDQKRKTELETFGISNEIIRDLQSASQTQLAIARDAEKQKDYPAFAAATDSLLAMQAEEYQTLINTSNGIIHGVIFLLLGVIPFSYFLERLLIGSPNVYKQIGWFAVFFVLMTFGLWFHPAFRISSSPLMIL
ncbi:MAG TPA: hypothetical protein VHM90_16440, partial [Phycisphaerae bacterium]|nr:hypothetical protein [Phycisphaerae bacterium]